MSIFSRIFDLGKTTARQEAIRLGISIEEVERDLPFFHRNGALDRIERGQCVKDTVKRKRGALPLTWSFVQRDRKNGAQYPNGWMFVSADGSPPATLEGVLNKIATDWDEELLEFEATESEVSAFWEEWGGIKEVNRIFNFLQELAEA